MNIKKKLFSKNRNSKIGKNLNKSSVNKGSNSGYLSAALTICVATVLFTTIASDAMAAGTAVPCHL